MPSRYYPVVFLVSGIRNWFRQQSTLFQKFDLECPSRRCAAARDRDEQSKEWRVTSVTQVLEIRPSHSASKRYGATQSYEFAYHPRRTDAHKACRRLDMGATSCNQTA